MRTVPADNYQKNLYEMSQYYPEDVDEEGNLHYGNFDAYFTDPAGKACE